MKSRWRRGQKKKMKEEHEEERTSGRKEEETRGNTKTERRKEGKIIRRRQSLSIILPHSHTHKDRQLYWFTDKEANRWADTNISTYAHG